MNAIRVMRRRCGVAVLAVAAALGVCQPLAADEAAVKKPSSVPQRAADAAASRVPASVRADGVASVVSTGQVVFQVLLAEIALRRGDMELASTIYADLAARTRDPKVLERTVEVAGYARRFDLALEAARRRVEIEPSSKPAQYMLAGVLAMSNQLDELAPVLIRLFEADRDALPENLLGLNRMLARHPDRRAVFQTVETVGRAFTGQPEAHYAIAVAAASAGVFDRARAEARRALELRPDWEMAALFQAQLLARLSNDDAIVFLQEFIGRYPQAREARMQLARLLISAKRYTDARQAFQQVLKIAPDSVDAVYAMGIMALQLGEVAEAEAQFKHFLTLPAGDKSYAYFFLGQIAEERGQTGEALADYARVVSGEHVLQARLRGARLLGTQGKLDEARRMLGATRAASPEDRVQLTVAEAALLRDAKQPQAAFDLLEALLAKQPEQPDLLYESALMAEKLGKIALMEERLRKLIELRPESAQAYNALGYSLADRNMRLPEARELIEKALRIAPEDYFILDSMGWVLYRQGELPEALAFLEKAYARRGDPEIAAHLGEVLWTLGRTDDARKTWLEAQKKHPDNESLSETIRKFLP